MFESGQPRKRDPHLSSLLGKPIVRRTGITKKDGLNALWRVHYRDEKGEKYFRLKEKVHPAGQEFFAKILKSIVPVADVRQAQTKNIFGQEENIRVSRVMPLENAHALSDAQIHALYYVIADIFKDTDRGHSLLLDHNLATRRESFFSDKKSLSIYDLEEMVVYFMEPSGLARSDDFFGSRTLRPYSFKNIRSRGEEIREYQLEGESIEVLESLEELLVQLRDRFVGEDGLTFIRAVVASVGTPLGKAIHFPDDIRKKDISNDPDYYHKAFLKVLRDRVGLSLRSVRKVIERKRV